MESPVKNGSPVPLPDSLWAATTAAAPELAALKGDRSADVVVVGAGFMTGMGADGAAGLLRP